MKNMKKILINCSNLHVGGGVAVATSFIDCLSVIQHDDIDISLLLSSEVDQNLSALGVDPSLFTQYIVKDFFGLNALWKGLDNYFRDIDLVFTVFGPAYYLFPRAYHIVGFAQPYIVYPSNPISKNLSIPKKLIMRVKYKIQEWFYSRANSLVVELEHVERALRHKRLFMKKTIHIVYSSVHSVFNEPDKWGFLEIPFFPGSIKLGIISRNYPHKNLEILPDVKKRLQREYGLNVEFFVTLRDEEWMNCSLIFRKEIVNVGGLDLNQCPTFYSFMDGVIFPSFLECFSAVPIEAMMSKKPLFASDLPFIRDVCSCYCNYFKPSDSVDIARSISEYFYETEDQKAMFIDNAYNFVQEYPCPEKRASKYLSIIRASIC